MAYSHDGASSIHPLDEAMQLPARSFSYELQKRLVKAAVQGPFRESTERTHEFSGLTVPKRSLEQIVQEAAQDFDAFYAQRPPEPSQPAASILVVAVDCKGIPIVQPHYTKLPAGLPQGPKTNRKQMATVAAVFTREPWIRTPEQVVASLFRIDTNTGANPSPPPRPEHKRVWASLLKGQVIKGLRQTVTKRKLFGAKRKTLLQVADYFHRNADRMRYDEYLAQGLPIATGSVEGACKNLIKDRMERSGMRWTRSMAEAIVKLRAAYLSGDFDTYWNFHVTQDQQRLYPQGRWAVS
jgi:hypothetical protein